MIDRVRSNVALAAKGLRRAFSSINVIHSGVVKTAAAAVEERVSVGGGAACGFGVFKRW